VSRLEAFLDQARQAQQQQKAGKTPTLDPSQLLSLAVTGWLLGSPAAEAKPAAALRLWQGRQMALDYLQAAGQGQRQQVLAGYAGSQADRVSVDDMVQMIPQLPPVDPDKNVSTAPIQRQVGNGAGGISYLVQLPPEYHPGRAYPVLVVLHQGGEKPATMLGRWSEAAADNGYILMAPSWEQGIGNAYGYSEQEHATVVQSLWDLKRHYKVDSDRVFLFGCGQGGLMAYDVGLSHPDLFAGVVPMSAGPEYFSQGYFRNGQYLPFYIINGDRHGKSNERTRDQMDTWVKRGYPMIWVQYKGRGGEWFGGEIPNIFDWMRLKKRAVPLHQLGTNGGGSALGNELMTMRQTDNHFYWLSTAQVTPACLNTLAGWRPAVQPAMIYAKVDPQANAITIKTSGLRQVTLWLGRNAQGQNMVDLTKPVLVRTTLDKPLARKNLTPSLETLLEDLYQRGDRQLLFLARIDLNF
jgi:pimeloyl-ACP methyl ester carboxylesterase